MKNNDEEVNWIAIIARCMAQHCLKNSEYKDKPILEQAQFLEKLGLPVEDRAGIIGSTVASLRVLSSLSKAKKKKGTTKNDKAKRR